MHLNKKSEMVAWGHSRSNLNGKMVNSWWSKQLIFPWNIYGLYGCQNDRYYHQSWFLVMISNLDDVISKLWRHKWNFGQFDYRTFLDQIYQWWRHNFGNDVIYLTNLDRKWTEMSSFDKSIWIFISILKKKTFFDFVQKMKIFKSL